jgi:thiol-disulfide isomerase/thioredoxin
MSLTAFKRWLFLVPLALACVLAHPSFAQDHEDDEDDQPTQKLDKDARAQLEKIDAASKEAVELLTNKKYPEAIAILEKLIETCKSSKLPESVKKDLESNAHYNLACGLSLTGKKPEAIAELEKTIALGWYDWTHIEKDTDLDPIRGEEGFKKAIADGKKLQSESWAKEAREALAGKPLFDLDLDLKTIDGKPWKLSDHKGKVVIVDVWGTWCPPCRREIPHFVKLAADHQGKVEIVGLAVEKPDLETAEAIEGIKAYAETAGIKYPLVNWSDDEAKKKIPDFKAFPTTIFVDKEGKVRLVKVGYHDHATLEGYVKGLLGDEKKD